MAAWLEHAACQLQAVEQVFFCSVNAGMRKKQLRDSMYHLYTSQKASLSKFYSLISSRSNPNSLLTLFSYSYLNDVIVRMHIFISYSPTSLPVSRYRIFSKNPNSSCLFPSPASMYASKHTLSYSSLRFIQSDFYLPHKGQTHAYYMSLSLDYNYLLQLCGGTCPIECLYPVFKLFGARRIMIKYLVCIFKAHLVELSWKKKSWPAGRTWHTAAWIGGGILVRVPFGFVGFHSLPKARLQRYEAWIAPGFWATPSLILRGDLNEMPGLSCILTAVTEVSLLVKQEPPGPKCFSIGKLKGSQTNDLVLRRQTHTNKKKQEQSNLNKCFFFLNDSSASVFFFFLSFSFYWKRKETIGEAKNQALERKEKQRRLSSGFRTDWVGEEDSAHLQLVH
ncbi:hypothetical protein VP01_2813g2 [Puccinia sorghi]|uniref:Uncharacterized protein n=1 Tax=Puccinia sorghi TaxID=27349 RepID=A0A0L6V349_9BASI|nr:hypothetical protein VP01_2813g2 [Puccinia sorghi]